eukprot:TRINITY_DN8917_c0_g1_i1.p2 TRINITY_DN8917_c0_g1~~TRINITY_DN8917_c0_g1_i1.p2  ORF type:complete len:223 (-),score=53.70 TRINITY_DN8917_c0_g1_i1:251-919(-)
MSAISSVVPDGPNKIFIGGLPQYLNELHIKQFLTNFGQLKAFNLVKESGQQLSKGYCFCEFVDDDSSSVTEHVCTALSGVVIGEKPLVVQRAHIGAKTSSASGSGSGNTSMNAGTKVVQFMNMLSLEELRDTAEYNDIVIDIREECAKYGKVLSIEIPRPTPEHGLGGIYGKAFVEFDSVEAAKLAANNIAGRLFNNRPVTVAFVNEDEYHEYRLSVNASSE